MGGGRFWVSSKLNFFSLFCKTEIHPVVSQEKIIPIYYRLFMRFLVYSISFAPEKIGSGKYNGELVNWLITNGHAVDVITTYPYYPEWRVSSADKFKGWTVSKNGKLNIYRVPCWVPQKPTTHGRIIQELTFFLSSSIIFLKFLFSNRIDIIFCMSPPLLIGVPGILLGKIKSIPVWYHIQDLQLDAAKDLGMLNKGLMVQILERVELWILKKSTIVSSISNNMKSLILKKGVHESKYRDLSNWVDTDKLKPLEGTTIRDTKKRYNLPLDQKIILYSGNIGEKQGLDLIVDTARLSTDKNWLFVIAGEGAIKAKLVALIEEYNLENILIKPLVPYDEFSDFLNCADVHLIIQKKLGGDNALPSKLGSISAVGGLIIAATNVDSSLAQIILEHSSGRVIEPENPNKLNEELIELLSEEALQSRLSLKKNARNYASEKLGIDSTLNKFIKDTSLIVGHS